MDYGPVKQGDTYRYPKTWYERLFYAVGARWLSNRMAMRRIVRRRL